MPRSKPPIHSARTPILTKLTGVPAHIRKLAHIYPPPALYSAHNAGPRRPCLSTCLCHHTQCNPAEASPYPQAMYTHQNIAHAPLRKDGHSRKAIHCTSLPPTATALTPHYALRVRSQAGKMLGCSSLVDALAATGGRTSHS